MTIVVDTSAWIEWLEGGPLSDQLRPHMPAQISCIVPTLVQHELAKWLVRERGEETCNEIIAYTMTCHVAPLDTATALLAAEIGRAHRLATADAIVYATAFITGSTLLTCDAHFSRLPHVTFVPKPGNRPGGNPKA